MNDANTSSTALSDAILTPPASLQFGLEKNLPANSPQKPETSKTAEARGRREMVMMTKKGCLVLLTLALAMCQVRSQMKPPLGGQAGFPPNGPVTVHVSR